MKRFVAAGLMALLIGCDSSDPMGESDMRVDDGPGENGSPELRAEDARFAMAVDFDDSVSVYVGRLGSLGAVERVSTGSWNEPLALQQGGERLLFINPGSDCAPEQLDLTTGEGSDKPNAGSLCTVRSKHVMWPASSVSVLLDAYEHIGFLPDVSTMNLETGAISELLQGAFPLALSGDSLLVAFPGSLPANDHRFGIYSLSTARVLDAQDPPSMRFRTGLPMDPELSADLDSHLGMIVHVVRSGSSSQLFVGRFDEEAPAMVYSTDDEIHSVNMGSDGYVYMAVHPDPGRLGGARIERIRILGDNVNYRPEILLEEGDIPGSIGMGWAVFE